jgi:hypothetical protein
MKPHNVRVRIHVGHEGAVTDLELPSDNCIWEAVLRAAEEFEAEDLRRLTTAESMAISRGDVEVCVAPSRTYVDPSETVGDGATYYVVPRHPHVPQRIMRQRLRDAAVQSSSFSASWAPVAQNEFTPMRMVTVPRRTHTDDVPHWANSAKPSFFAPAPTQTITPRFASPPAHAHFDLGLAKATYGAPSRYAASQRLGRDPYAYGRGTAAWVDWASSGDGEDDDGGGYAETSSPFPMSMAAPPSPKPRQNSLHGNVSPSPTLLGTSTHTSRGRVVARPREYSRSPSPLRHRSPRGTRKSAVRMRSASSAEEVQSPVGKRNACNSFLPRFHAPARCAYCGLTERQHYVGMLHDMRPATPHRR